MSDPQRILLKGTLTNGKELEEREVSVLAGEGGVTPTEGWAKWAKVPRWGRVGLTVLEGYEPFALQVPVLFDSVTNPSYDVEKEIQSLEWMGGRGIAFGPTPPGSRRKVGTPGVGDSPLIQVYARDSNDHEVHLVPKQFQTADLRWVVDGNRGGISFDANPLRAAKTGNRIRQAATINLTQHIPSPGHSFDSTATRVAYRKGLHGSELRHTTRSMNTVAKVVQDSMVKNHVPPSHRSKVISEVLAANKLGTNPNKGLKVGTPVKVPFAALTSA